MRPETIRIEMTAITTRAGVEEARRLAALERGDRSAAHDAAIELARLHARYCDLEHREDEP